MSFRAFSTALWSISVLFVLALIAALPLPSRISVPFISDIVHRPNIEATVPVLLILSLFIWVLFEIWMRRQSVRTEHRAVADFQSLMAKADLGQYQPKTYDLKAPRAIRRADLIVECSRRDPSSLHEAIPAAAALDANTLNAAYTPLNVYAWILPVLGFIGTASGMAASIGGFRDALRGGQGQVEALAAQLGQSVIPGLSGAFETTILALAAALVAYLCTSALRSWDQEALDELDRFCVVLLSRIPQPPSPDGEKILGVLERISEQMRDILNVPVTIEAAAKAISDTAEALSASSNQFDSVLSSMGTAAEALATASLRSESAATALKAAAETLKPTDTKAASDVPRKDDALETLAAVLRNFEGIMAGVEGTMKGIQKTLEEPVTVVMKRGQS